MDTLLQVGLSNAVVATLLALVVSCIGLVWRRPALLHSLWLLVLLKLLTPPLVWVPVPWPAKPFVVVAMNPSAVETAAESDPTPTSIPELDGTRFTLMPDPLPEAFVPVGTEEAPPLLSVSIAPPEEKTPTLTDLAPAPPAPDWSAWWETAVLGVWLAGSGLWFLCATRRLLCFQGLLRHARLAPLHMQKQTDRLARKLGMTRTPTVYLVPGQLSPMLWAFFGPPRLVLPADLLAHLDDEQRATLILHELAHLRRRDHWVRALEFVAMGLFWWHPVVWYVRRELREAEELCCDAWVVSALPLANRTYATALVETIDFLSAVRSPVPLLASGVGPISDLKRRLTMIMRGTTPRTLSWRGLCLVCGLGAFLLPLLPAFAQADDRQPEVTTIELSGDVINLLAAGGDSGDAPQNQTEAAHLEAQLLQKQREIRDLQAKIRALRDRLPPADGAKSATSERTLAYRFLIAASQGGEPQEIILRRVGDKWEVVEPRLTSRALLQAAPLLNRVGEGNPGVRIHGPAGTESDRRLNELEKKLEKIMNQIEQMRQQMKAAPRQALIDRGFFPAQDGPIVPQVIDRGFGPSEEGGRVRPIRPGGTAPVVPGGSPPRQQ